MGKFDKWVYEFKPDDANWGDWSHGPQAFLHGEKDLEGANTEIQEFVTCL